MSRHFTNTNHLITSVILNLVGLHFHWLKHLKEKVWFVPHRVAKLEISNKFQQDKWTLTSEP